MPQHITFEKVEEVIQLAEAVRRHPAEAADDPQRGSEGNEDVPGPVDPPIPQPVRGWGAALEGYLTDLPMPALQALVALYDAGRQDRSTATGTTDTAGSPERDSLKYLLSRDDLASCLRRELKRV